MPLRRCEALSVLRRRTSRLRRRAAGVSLGVPTNIGNVERPACQECFKCTFHTNKYLVHSYVLVRLVLYEGKQLLQSTAPPVRVTKARSFSRFPSLIHRKRDAAKIALRTGTAVISQPVYSTTRHGVLEQAASNKMWCFSWRAKKYFVSN